MIGIYCITNIQNGMRYVGQSRNIEKRFGEHFRDDIKLKTKLGEAIREYGSKNFTLTILEECKIEELDEKERKWIKELNTYPDEYNMTIGGRDQVYDLNKLRAIPTEEVVKLWEQGLSISQIMKRHGKSCTNTIKNQLLEKGYKQKDIEKRGKLARAKGTSKIVQQYSLQGDFIAEYYSLNEAGRATNTSSQNIGKVCKGIRPTAGGFIWKYK